MFLLFSLYKKLIFHLYLIPIPLYVSNNEMTNTLVVVVVLLFYVHGKHLRSCRDGQLT